jgi:hypothetical protein
VRQRLSNVGDEIVRGLNADRQANCCVEHADAAAYIRRHARMRHSRWMAGERLGAAETNGEFEHLQRVEEGESFRLPALDIELEGRAAARRLTFECRSRRALAEKRKVVHPGNARVIAQEFGDDLRIRIGLLHAQR